MHPKSWLTYSPILLFQHHFKLKLIFPQHRLLQLYKAFQLETCIFPNHFLFLQEIPYQMPSATASSSSEQQWQFIVNDVTNTPVFHSLIHSHRNIEMWLEKISGSPVKSSSQRETVATLDDDGFSFAQPSLGTSKDGSLFHSQSLSQQSFAQWASMSRHA